MDFLLNMSLEVNYVYEKGFLCLPEVLHGFTLRTP